MPVNLKKNLGIALVIALFLIIGIYAYTKSKAVREGVELTVTGVIDGETVTEGTLDLSGLAKNATVLLLDDRPISVNEDGIFTEKLLLIPGYNIVTFKAQDRFGKKTQKTFRVVYTPIKIINN